MRLVDRVMEQTLVYKLWQEPFAERKFAPVRAHNDVAAARRVLDVGCGPGTNAHHFAHASYVGIDHNPRYIADARKRHRGEFLVADVTRYEMPPERRFDFILANSFLHHVDTASARRILAHVATLLTPDGHVHILDLVLPERLNISRVLARADRGDHPRPLETWRELFSSIFEPVVFEPYPLGAFGTTLWSMVYFKGRAKR